MIAHATSGSGPGQIEVILRLPPNIVLKAVAIVNYEVEDHDEPANVVLREVNAALGQTILRGFCHHSYNLVRVMNMPLRSPPLYEIRSQVRAYGATKHDIYAFFEEI